MAASRGLGVGLGVDVGGAGSSRGHQEGGVDKADRDRLIAALAECPSVCEHLHLPVQSGDDGVLPWNDEHFDPDVTTLLDTATVARLQQGGEVLERRLTRILREKGARVVLLSHLGRPKGGPDPKYSLKPVADVIAAKLGKPVRLVKDWVEGGFDVAEGELVLLENCRFNKGEKKSLDETSQKYAKLCDIFVMDAFGTAPADIADDELDRLSARELERFTRVDHRDRVCFVKAGQELLEA